MCPLVDLAWQFFTFNLFAINKLASVSIVGIV